MEFDADLINNVINSMDAGTDQPWNFIGEVSMKNGLFSCVIEIEEGPLVRCTKLPEEWEAIIVDNVQAKSGILHKDLTEALNA
jgi:hypothetical protein